jgi:hypothetical protein
MRTFPIAALLAIGAFASVVPDTGHAKLSKREFCAVAEYCRIPVQFRRGPFLAQPLLREMPIREIQKNCSRDGHAAGPFGVNSPVIGCAKFQDTNCVVYLPKEVRDLSKDIFDMVVEHELAHCRGWTHGP